MIVSKKYNCLITVRWFGLWLIAVGLLVIVPHTASELAEY